MSTSPGRSRPTLLLAGVLLLASAVQAPAAQDGAAQDRAAGENDADLRYYVYVSGLT